MVYMIGEVDYTEDVELARQRVFDPMADDVAETLISSLSADVASLSHHVGGVGLNSPGIAFVENVTSTIHTVSLLYNTLFGNVLMEKYGEHRKERQGEAEANLGRSLTEEEKILVEPSALSDLGNPKQMEAAKIWTLHRVNVIWHRNIIAMSGPQVLRQGVVLLWGAFEVLGTDLMLAAADAQPTLLARVIASNELRQTCKIGVADWNDVTLWPQNREKIKLNSMGSISTAYRALLPGVGTTLPSGLPIFAWFADPQLTILGQRRHLIVHRAAVKDAEYLTKSGDSGNVGDKLVVTPNDFRNYAETVIRIGTQMLQAIDAEL